MATYTYVAIVVGFFALAFAFGFIAGVAHERDKYISGVGSNSMSDLELKQTVARLNYEAQGAASKLIKEWGSNPFIPLDLTPNDWQETESTIDITIAIWSVRVVEETLMEDDIYFESTFSASRNRHRIKLPEYALALLDSIGVQYELITEKE